MATVCNAADYIGHTLQEPGLVLLGYIFSPHFVTCKYFLESTAEETDPTQAIHVIDNLEQSFVQIRNRIDDTVNAISFKYMY